MRRFTLLLIVVACVSCVNELESIEMDNEMEPTCLNDLLNLTDGVIIGQKLRNPYSIEVMKEACDLLYPPTRGETPASDTIIVPNVKYVRFLPADSTEFRLLMESGLELFNYPLDYEILGDPSDYRDPNVSPERITWQYAVMPIDQDMPATECSEILEIGFLPEFGVSDPDYDMVEIEHTAMGIVLDKFINGPMDGLTPGGSSISGGTTSGGTTSGSTDSDEDRPEPTGRILVKADGAEQSVRGIKVRAKYFYKIKVAYTEEDGSYYIDMRYFDGCNPRFELRFHNRYNFDLGYGLDMIIPVTKNMKHEKNYTADKEESRKFWVACMVNNAAYDWYARCEREGMPTPPDNMYIWVMSAFSGASCPMLNHGVLPTIDVEREGLWEVLFGADSNPFYCLNAYVLLEMIRPDITICNVDNDNEQSLYRKVSHELAHATHFTQLGSNDIARSLWWSYVFNYEVACILLSLFDDPYEHPSVPREERAGITEMWAHAVGYICKYEHRQRNVANYRDGSNGIYDEYWFAPEILLDLYERGMTLKQISDCMTEDVITFEDFRETLIVHNSTYASRINYLFDNYLDD